MLLGGRGFEDFSLREAGSASTGSANKSSSGGACSSMHLDTLVEQRGACSSKVLFLLVLLCRAPVSFICFG